MRAAAKCRPHQTARKRANSKRSRCARTLSCAASMFQPRVARILKGRFDAHAPRICVNACFARREVGNDQPSLLILLLPTGTHRGLDALLLPDTRTPIPLLTFLRDKALEGTPAAPLFVLAHLAAAGMLLTDAQHVMPVALLTEPNQWD